MAYLVVLLLGIMGGWLVGMAGPSEDVSQLVMLISGAICIYFSGVIVGWKHGEIDDD